MDTQTRNDWISTADAAVLFDYDVNRPGGRTAFLEFARREGVPHYRMSERRIRWSRPELEEWLKHRRVGGRNLR